MAHLDLSLNWTFLYVLALVLVVYAVSGPLLFKPLVDLLDRREWEAVERLREAEGQLKTAEDKALQFGRQLNAARKEMARVRQQALQASDEAGRAKIDTVRAEINERLRLARGELERQVQAANQQLVTQVPALAKQMAQKILGRGV